MTIWVPKSIKVEFGEDWKIKSTEIQAETEEDQKRLEILAEKFRKALAGGDK